MNLDCIRGCLQILDGHFLDLFPLFFLVDSLPAYLSMSCESTEKPAKKSLKNHLI